MSDWPEGYQLIEGSSLDRSRLVTTMASAYGELGATQLGHLTKTVELYFESPSMLWWLEKSGTSRVGFTARQPSAIGCLWLGQSINQLTGALQAYIYLVYVEPAYRRQGLGRGLMNHARRWAQEQGYAQMSLQVFCKNKVAIQLYEDLGFMPTATLLTLDV
ncbi:GNAT family N-acetyltransferase [Leptothoe spongobia]|uniref:GNAT family N-acetyltransferase n=1 Tax=Leptothoe spongobia TaxID=2651728 RepID=UPI002DD66441|nr:GNAT family N-acetyltransferase [Leptothoe spongobia]